MLCFIFAIVRRLEIMTHHPTFLPTSCFLPCTLGKRIIALDLYWIIVKAQKGMQRELSSMLTEESKAKVCSTREDANMSAGYPFLFDRATTRIALGLPLSSFASLARYWYLERVCCILLGCRCVSLSS